MTPMMKRAPLFLVVVACGRDPEPISIAPPTPTSSVDNGAPVAPPAPRRVVSFRDPFGDVAFPDNLMVDGDFELTGRSGQMPWISAGNMGARALDYGTGGRCRSGIRCASVPAGTFLIGYLATPSASKLFVRAWAKPDSGACTDVKISLVDGLSNSVVANCASQTPGPDEGGWCRFELVTTFTSYHQPILYVQSPTTRALLDDVIALPTTGAKPLLAGPPLTKAEEERAKRVIESTKYREKPTFPPPTERPPAWIETP